MEKNNLYVSAYHIPLIMSWPKNLQANKEVNRYVSIVDFQQTLLNVVGLEPSGNEEGRDATPLIYGQDIEWVDEIYIHPSDVPRAGLITPTYQLAYVGRGWNRPEDHKFKDHILFDRVKDKEQLHNLFGDEHRKDTVERLKQKMTEHFEGLQLEKELLPPALFR